MSDLLKDLRNPSWMGSVDACRMREAADEIEHLQKAEQDLTAALARSCDDSRFGDTDVGCPRSAKADAEIERLLNANSELDRKLEEAEDARNIALKQLTNERERMWCSTCGTVTRSGECDCTRMDTGTQNFVNYADSLKDDCRLLREHLVKAKDALSELERCCDVLAATRSQMTYDSMICDGQADHLLAMDRARATARALTDDYQRDSGAPTASRGSAPTNAAQPADPQTSSVPSAQRGEE